MESAADFLGLFGGGYYDRIYVYSSKDIARDGVETIKVSDLSVIESEEYDDIRCTTIERTIADLLVCDRDYQSTVESMVRYYFRHNESWSGLVIPEEARKRFEEYREDAINYYND